MVGSEGNNLVFVFSLPRSGSTLLSLMLGNHSKVHCPPEPWFLLRLAEVCGEPSSEKIFDDYFASIASKEFLTEEAFLKSSRAFALEAYNDCLERKEREVFVDKTPRYYHICGFIDRLFPNAKKIWLKRNPLDVAISYKKTWNIGVDTLICRRIDPTSFDLILGLHLLKEYFEDESPYKYEVKYEDIVRYPEEEIKKLCSFCGFAYETKMLQYARNEELMDFFEKAVVGDRYVLGHDGPHTNSIGRWKKELSEGEVSELVSTIGAEIFRHMGYEETLRELDRLSMKDSSAERSVVIPDLEELYKKTRFGAIFKSRQELRLRINGMQREIDRGLDVIQELGEKLEASNADRAARLDVIQEQGTEIIRLQQQLNDLQKQFLVKLLRRLRLV